MRRCCLPDEMLSQTKSSPRADSRLSLERLTRFPLIYLWNLPHSESILHCSRVSRQFEPHSLGRRSIGEIRSCFYIRGDLPRTSQMAVGRHSPSNVTLASGAKSITLRTLRVSASGMQESARGRGSKKSHAKPGGRVAQGVCWFAATAWF
jgi:hypothetical protein